MTGRSPLRPIATMQLVAVLASTLALFFMFAFASKLVEAYRLRGWRDGLESEISAMRIEKLRLESEIERRKSLAWVDEVLRSAGRLPEGAIAVVPVPLDAPYAEQVPRPPRVRSSLIPHVAEGIIWFDNQNWEAWRRLIWGFDGERALYYNP